MVKRRNPCLDLRSIGESWAFQSPHCGLRTAQGSLSRGQVCLNISHLQISLLLSPEVGGHSEVGCASARKYTTM